MEYTYLVICFIKAMLAYCTTGTRDPRFTITRNRTVTSSHYTTDVFSESHLMCAMMCSSQDKCCVASFSQETSICRLDTTDNCCVATDMDVGWSTVAKVNNCTINLKEVAYNKSAEQSSVYEMLSALEAVDGNVNTYMHTNLEQSPFWIVDLGKTYQIRRIEIFNRNEGAITTGERLRDLDIMIGPSPDGMHLCAHYVGPAQLGDHLLFNCEHVENARYVKLTLIGTHFLHVAEVKVYAVIHSSTLN
ncbi:unnamed protein product [Mytilus edulis]|uniref:Fucolectin tachylectin-4 pentraxin-1 domain-containing protein n=1 Tax=Mytilus edulis TaxID=6550 RepID=A0A8S3VHL5_MYTED|nr:unnamed protein product [Mytilus edulis]